ncbi:MAG: NAD-dependent deacylase [Pseudomonadota bacterium]
MTELVILTGAGVSAESGLATFRDAGGLWEGHRPEYVATPEAFARDPAMVHRFYNARRAAARAARPNAAHGALAQLQRALGPRMLLVTQNVDALHEAAGHEGVVHMHGALDGACCASCGATWRAPPVMAPQDPCPSCGVRSTRPDIVWFGEMPKAMDRLYTALSRCAVFAAIGTSGQVYPAAGFVDVAAQAGAACWELNLAPSGNPRFAHHATGPASTCVPDWCREIEAQLRP